MTENNSIEFLNKQLYKSKRKILKLCGWSDSNFNSNRPQNKWLEDLKQRRSKEFDLSKVEPNPVLPESVLDGFIMEPHKLFIDDDIDYHTQKEFEIGFDILSERIVIPIRDKSGSLVGIKGRATNREDEERYKYLYIYPYHKSKEWFNLHRALPHIESSNTVVCFESEKSCLKAHSMGHFNTVSQQGKDITKIQAEMLKRISPDLKIILAYDKDVDVSEVKQLAKTFNYKNIHGIVDVENFLHEKQSPVDAGKKVWEELYNNHCYKIFPK